MLKSPSPIDGLISLRRAHKLDLATISGNSLSLEIPHVHQAIDIHRNQVRFHTTLLNNIAGSLALRVVRKEQQDVKGTTRNTQLVAEWFAQKIVCSRTTRYLLVHKACVGMIRASSVILGLGVSFASDRILGLVESFSLDVSLGLIEHPNRRRFLLASPFPFCSFLNYLYLYLTLSK